MDLTDGGGGPRDSPHPHEERINEIAARWTFDLDGPEFSERAAPFSASGRTAVAPRLIAADRRQAQPGGRP
jgi:hypothetical protein